MKERRIDRRYPVKGIRGYMHIFAELNVINISVDGMALETTDRLEVNREYRFKIDHQGAPLNINGFVTWCKLTRSERRRSGEVVPIYKAGIKFIDLIDVKANTLLSFIEEHKVETPERRFSMRYKITSSEDIKIGYPYEYDVRKISLSGMEIETDYTIEPDFTHDMEILLKEGTLNVTGGVVSCTEVASEGSSRYVIGVEFIEVANKDKELLKHFIHNLEKSVMGQFES